MCTAISIGGKRHLFGRTLDVPASYGERPIVIPRRCPLAFLHEGGVKEHPALIGMGILSGGFPLLFEAMNEEGLAVAALNFPLSARYGIGFGAKHRLASFEVIPYLLSLCRNAREAAERLSDAEITAESVSPELPATPMHWLIADPDEAFAAEPLGSGLKIIQNPRGVLTNEPPFEEQSKESSFVFDLTAESRGTLAWSGALGLRGDFSSPSRYGRALFARRHGAPDEGLSEAEAACAFLRILDTVSVPRGCVVTEKGEMPYTVYASCFSSQSLSCFCTGAYTRTVLRYPLFGAQITDGRPFFPRGDAQNCF